MPSRANENRDRTRADDRARCRQADIPDERHVAIKPQLAQQILAWTHNRVRFLDELPECRCRVLEVLRQPLEERVI